MSHHAPKGVDCSWVWPNGELVAQELPDTPQLDALSLEQVLPILMSEAHPQTRGADKELRRLRGAHYTPIHLVDAVLSELCFEASYRILDPAMGAGVWLRIWLRKWVEQGYGQEIEGLQCLYGMDIDALAVGVSRFLLWEMTDWNPKAIEVLIHQLRCADACLGTPMTWWPECRQGFDCILGNPPWLFLSGRGSPVARLRREGQIEAADTYQAWIAEVSQRFPAFSKGCKDIAKWFVGLSLGLLRLDGQLVFVLPEAFIRLPRYRDVRFALASKGHVRVWVNQVGTFSVTSVSCVVFLSGGPPCSTIQYRDLREDREVLEIKIVDSDWPIYRSRWAEDCYAASEDRLGDWVTVKEGVHELYFEAVEGGIPVLAVDAAGLGHNSEVGTKAAYLLRPCSNQSDHVGERIVIRKTGSKICAALVNTEVLAYAHQNVYVLKLKSACPVPARRLVDMLNDPLLSRLYQHSPLGQPEQPMAQLRISALRKLPIPHELCIKYDIV